jgi:hypothetical protein
MRDTLPLRLMLATATLVLGVQGALGVWFTWASGYDLSDTGFMYVQGFLAFGGAVGLAVVSLFYCVRRINDPQYVLPSTFFATLSLAASIWFWSTEVGTQQTHLLVNFFITPRVTAGTRWYLMIGSSAAALACIAAFAFESHRAHAPQEHHIHLEWRPE